MKKDEKITLIGVLLLFVSIWQLWGLWVAVFVFSVLLLIDIIRADSSS